MAWIHRTWWPENSSIIQWHLALTRVACACMWWWYICACVCCRGKRAAGHARGAHGRRVGSVDSRIAAAAAVVLGRRHDPTVGARQQDAAPQHLPRRGRWVPVCAPAAAAAATAVYVYDAVTVIRVKYFWLQVDGIKCTVALYKVIMSLETTFWRIVFRPEAAAAIVNACVCYIHICSCVTVYMTVVCVCVCFRKRSAVIGGLHALRVESHGRRLHVGQRLSLWYWNITKDFRLRF